MLFEEVYESLLHRHRDCQPTAEEHGRLILRRVHELLKKTADVDALEETPSEVAHTEQRHRGSVRLP